MKRMLILICLLLYGGLWWHFKNEILWSDRYLSPSLPVPVLKVASGYGQHMTGFSLFVKTAIFTGGNRLAGMDELTYAGNLAQNYDAAAQLYPKFIDTYFFAQSFLPHISKDFASATNQILERGVAAHPDYLFFPFFQAFNYFRYLDEPLKAADIFEELSKMPDAPAWFASLSSKLRARGGQLSAGRDMLVVLYESEAHEGAKERYAKEIENFDKALLVQQALDMYRQEHGEEATLLEDLIPKYLPELPDLNLGYVLHWKPPTLKLFHPATR